MDIKVSRIEDGPARVEILDANGETISMADVNVGQNVTITTSDSPENPPCIGEVQETAEPQGEQPDEGTPETDQPGDEQPGGQGGAEQPSEPVQ